MRNGSVTLLGSAAVLLFLASAGGQARADVFVDTFEEEAPGGLNYSPFQHWTVSTGTVDVIPATGLGLPAAHGFVVDLDGSTNQAGIFTSNAITLAPGNYRLTFDMAGSQRGDTNIVNLGIGTSSNSTLFASDVLTANSGDPFSTHTYNFTVVTATTLGQIQFHNLGGDNVGALLDNVDLVALPPAAPEPGVLALIGSMSVTGIGVLARRRRKTSC